MVLVINPHVSYKLVYESNRVINRSSFLSIMIKFKYASLFLIYNVGVYMSDLDYSELKNVAGVEEAIELQKEKLDNLRKEVKKLVFKKIDIAGSYTSITFKAVDGGKMRVNLNPFEINLIDVADSNFNKKLSFVIPEIKSYGDSPEDKKMENEITKKIDEIPIIKKFVSLLGKKSISEISYIFNNSDQLMELSEWACIFDRVTAEIDEPIVILKDGLLRSKSLMDVHIKTLTKLLKQKKKYVKLIGVSKTSSILSLISTAVFLEKKVPADTIGYIKIPLELELKAYIWSGSGKLKSEYLKPLDFAFGELYVVKLSKSSNLLVTIEIPKDLVTGEDIYSEEEINEIISYLAKDSKSSYPVVGYPQTIMRAHEAAVRLGFSASILRDEIKDRILHGLDKDIISFVRDGWLLTDFVDKGVLGGGKYE